jgi:hypothetical protein
VPLPSVERYLSELPAGFLSHPGALAKATVVLPWRAGAVGDALHRCRELPAALRALVEEPPAVSGWIPEVELAALILAAYDAHFAEAGGEDALQAYIHATNRAVFKGPLYAILFAVASPERLLVGAAQRWSAFHRGSKLEVVSREPGGAVMDLAHPAGIFSEHSLRGHGTSFALAAELAGGREVRATHERVAPGVTRYTLAWR